MSEPAGDYKHYLRPEVLAKIGGLELRARMVVEGYYTGMHRSPYRGTSVEYADRRPYTQGDDLRHIDWKVYGRTDKYYTKEYEQETNLECMLVVDCSESMTYRSPQAVMTKHQYATVIAASLTYLALNKQRDSVGLTLFDERITRLVRPSRNPSHWRTIIHELEGATGPAKTGIRAVLNDLAERLDHRVLIILVSDLFDNAEETLKGIAHLRFRRHEIIVCGVWDDAEYDFPFQGPTLFEGLEHAGRLLTEPRALRDRYLEEVRRFHESLRSGCHRLRVDYVPFRTSAPLDVAISAYLATRSTQIRKRSSRVLGGG
ncbi:MAG TPA: DUF58 domain-containing protein [Phycisphaerae bacterium]|nr:DUF58 domain-containing protein [Phycisphaerae bacterium]